jgi:hypothetical protein
MLKITIVKRCKVGNLRIFEIKAKRPAPNPCHIGLTWPDVWALRAFVASPSLSLLFLVFLRIRQAEQMVNICLCRNNLLHILFYGAVLFIALFFSLSKVFAILL